MKPGIRTSEFWLSLATMIIGASISIGLIPSDSSVVAKVAGLAMTVLASLGYTYSRTQQKVANAQATTPE